VRGWVSQGLFHNVGNVPLADTLLMVGLHNCASLLPKSSHSIALRRREETSHKLSSQQVQVAHGSINPLVDILQLHLFVRCVEVVVGEAEAHEDGRGIEHFAEK
jgi:hypothetical protein